MSFLKRLFGGAGEKGGGAKTVGQPAEHKGFTIRATPFQQDGQYQTCGVISKEIDGALKEHTFIRADRFPSADLAADQALRKGRQIIDEQGEAIFD
ncbi:HlyU family transcriptional regulator [Chelativorans intermedius]|uniref:HlyU family transcriptional regulator n=1 Tax=Chelativorans intermedius TaxID=515947 RepID=A0ABV6D523_9HYPH|nr:HlyU family transcriptional regulator [Chelativorans intermedius]MCT8997205.1 HlyU family transcriptional regulator [Chelativorans intermedius]